MNESNPSFNASLQTARIVRTVGVIGQRKVVQLELEDGYVLCSAYVDPDGSINFQPRQCWIQSLEQAGQVRIAIGMAMNWVAETLATSGNSPA